MACGEIAQSILVVRVQGDHALEVGPRFVVPSKRLEHLGVSQNAAGIAVVQTNSRCPGVGGVLQLSLLLQQLRLSLSKVDAFRIELESHSNFVGGLVDMPGVCQGQTVFADENSIVSIFLQLALEELERSVRLSELHIRVAQAYHGRGVGWLHVQGLLEEVHRDAGLFAAG